MEVRCCCNPGLLLGSLPEPPVSVAGRFVHFGEVSLEIAWLRLPLFKGQPYLAYKSMDYPIEKLRALPGWKDRDENNPDPVGRYGEPVSLLTKGGGL